MQVDALGLGAGWEAMKIGSDNWSDWLATATPEEVSSYYEGITEGLASEHPEQPVSMADCDSPLDALYKKGKSKGKGKNRWKDNSGKNNNEFR